MSVIPEVVGRNLVYIHISLVIYKFYVFGGEKMAVKQAQIKISGGCWEILDDKTQKHCAILKRLKKIVWGPNRLVENS